MEGFDYLEAPASNPNANLLTLYNLTVRFILQWLLIMIVEPDNTEAKPTKLARSHLL